MASFLRRFGTGLFLGYMTLGLVFMFRIPTTFNGGFDFAFKYLWLPLALLVFGFTLWQGERLEPARGKRWLMAILLYPMLLLFAGPYVLAVNVLGGPHPEVTYRGPIVSKFVSGARSKAYVVEIEDQATGKKISLETSLSQYATLRKGDAYERTMKLGLFGIPYAKRR